MQTFLSESFKTQSKWSTPVKVAWLVAGWLLLIVVNYFFFEDASWLYRILQPLPYGILGAFLLFSRQKKSTISFSDDEVIIEDRTGKYTLSISQISSITRKDDLFTISSGSEKYRVDLNLFGWNDRQALIERLNQIGDHAANQYSKS